MNSNFDNLIITDAIELMCMVIGHLCSDAPFNVSYGASLKSNWHRTLGLRHDHNSHTSHISTSVSLRTAETFMSNHHIIGPPAARGRSGDPTVPASRHHRAHAHRSMFHRIPGCMTLSNILEKV